MQKSLTDALVRSIAAPETGRIQISDARCSGLALRVSSSGAKSWSFRFRDPLTNRDERMTLGSYPDVTLADARERVDQLRRLVASGRNPITEKKKEREEVDTKTFGALASRYLREHAYRFKRSAPRDDRNLELHVLPHWRDRRFDEIRRSDVIALLEGMISSGLSTQANRIQALISKVFSFAVDCELLGANPCTRLRKRGVENVSERVLSDAELQLFWAGIILPPVSYQAGLALRIAATTAARVSEIAEAAKSEFQYLDDPSRSAWILPAARSKNGRAHYVPLVGLAREAVLEAFQRAGESPWLFPSTAVSDAPIKGHALSVAMMRFQAGLEPGEDLASEVRIKTPEERLQRREAKAALLASPAHEEAVETWRKVPPTPHDLRRTLNTRLSELGVVREDREAVLNHTPKGVNAVHYDLYDRAREKRRALSLWNDALSSILEGRQTGADIVPLRANSSRLG
ncbi:tyrosine-type recombinase/integrase [Microvirga sp. CF3016]|uniref:tyrosine-type recombinase/integrase n=1 Tax=Microvirga sp. CF3016 TaxID=3110181 RepID=UPI002E78D13E|nr:integrase arm-type DNA-binding domain-containing protein [Microvirga sp. CF3016]MEE1611109.1 integrase arm-type DNA-binding domain-containing protein [Microvirga sp. CF3016]